MNEERCPFCKGLLVRSESIETWTPSEGALPTPRSIYHVNCHDCDWGLMSRHREHLDRMIDSLQDGCACQ